MGIIAERLFTTREASAVSGIAVKTINSAIDKRVVRIKRVVRHSTAERSSRCLSEENLLLLKLWSEIGETRWKDWYPRLSRKLSQTPTLGKVNVSNFVILDLYAAREEISEGVRHLMAAESIVTRDENVMGGEPVFAGTRIPVRAIAAMLDAGASEDEILDGYPKLDSPMLSLARVWVAANPPRGRPKALSERGFILKESHKVSGAVPPVDQATSA